MKNISILIVLILVLSGSVAADRFPTPPASGASPTVQWKRSVDADWRQSAVRTLDQLPSWRGPIGRDERSRFGGDRSRKIDEGTGHFRVAKIDGQWAFVDPEGYAFFSVGLTSVRPRTGSPADEAYAARWDDKAAWGEETAALLLRLGYNTLGRWSDVASVNGGVRKLPYTTSLNFMGSFGNKHKLTCWGYGNAGYAHNAIPVFHPDFEKHCDALARKEIAPLADDPYVLGHFTDNELPMPRDLLATTLAIDPEEYPALRHNLEAAWEWYRERRGDEATIDAITDEDNKAYLGYVMDRYYAITTAAIRAHAPKHLNLGSRLHGRGIHRDEVIAAANRHLDVISINYYNVWGPAEKHLARWRHAAPDTPFLVTEFYTKGEDSGMDNDPGAGWIVPTQADRGKWYQHFTLRLLEAPHCVGWHYFNYQDNPGDSNKGILDTRFRPHTPFIDHMTPIHRHVYSLRRHFSETAR